MRYQKVMLIVTVIIVMFTVEVWFYWCALPSYLAPGALPLVPPLRALAAAPPLPAPASRLWLPPCPRRHRRRIRLILCRRRPPSRSPPPQEPREALLPGGALHPALQPGPRRAVPGLRRRLRRHSRHVRGRSGPGPSGLHLPPGAPRPLFRPPCFPRFRFSPTNQYNSAEKKRSQLASATVLVFCGLPAGVLARWQQLSKLLAGAGHLRLCSTPPAVVRAGARAGADAAAAARPACSSRTTRRRRTGS